jgi:hypothetical protein
VSNKIATRRADAARQRIEQIHTTLGRIDLLCSGTLSERMMKCGKPNCGCATDPAARHGPYYEWRHMRGTKIAQRYLTSQQAQVLRQAIDNYHLVKKLLRSWEENTERLIDADYPPQP